MREYTYKKDYIKRMKEEKITSKEIIRIKKKNELFEFCIYF